MSTFGRFVWHELMTTDAKAAAAFYGSVVGWGTQDWPGPVPNMPDATYRFFTNGSTPATGLMELTNSACASGAKPGWLGSIGVADVDVAFAKAQQLGASAYVPPTDIQDVGRFATMADPQKAAFVLFAPKPMEGGAGEPPGRGVPGHVGWHELHATDWQGAFAFYEAMFGWKKEQPFDMGPMGTYQLFSTGGEATGAMFNKPPQEPDPYWLYYITVADIDAATARIAPGGGKILNGPMEVPGGDWIVQAIDPQGAAFALVGKRAGG